MSRAMEKAGWAYPYGSRKAHYFPAGSSESLCRRYSFGFDILRDEGNDESPDNCAKCKRLKREM